MDTTKRLFLIVCFGLAVFAVVEIPAWDEPSPSYTIEVVSADATNSAETVNYSNLTTTEQQQFERSISTQRRYDYRPELAEYASEQIRYEGEVYTVLVTVAN